MRRRLLALAGLLLSTAPTKLLAAPQQAPPGDPVAAAVARPISPGSVALLLPHSARPEVVHRLIQAIQDPRPEVRAVAARVAFTTRHASLAPALAAAWDKESNDAAGAEIARALTLI